MLPTPDPFTRDLLAAGPYVREAAPHRAVRVAGPDAEDFLQRLCTQDVKGIVAGTAAPAAFLDPKGKVLVTCIAARAERAFWLEVQAEQEGKLLELLDRYRFTEKVTFVSPPWSCVEWTGAVWPADAALMDGTFREDLRGAADGGEDDGAVTFAVHRRGVRWARVHAARPTLPAGCAGLSSSPELDECLRMGAGFVRVGVDTEPSTLALEADLADHCSTTKGCYTGQEIVARIHTYGHVNRALCLLHLEGSGPIRSPQALHEPDDRTPVGRVMHAVQAPGKSFRVGLGYLPEDFQPLGTKLVLADGAAVTVAGFGSA